MNTTQYYILQVFSKPYSYCYCYLYLHMSAGNVAVAKSKLQTAALTLGNYYNLLLPSDVALSWQDSLLLFAATRVGAVIDKTSL